MELPQLEHLIRASREGDRDSFGRLVSACQGRVCAVAYALGGAAWGVHVFNGLARDPAAIELFNRWMPGLIPKGR
ncbi:MAG: hypothetical protein ACYC6Y_05000 [Thermoguttaceae bacterium]